MEIKRNTVSISLPSGGTLLIGEDDYNALLDKLKIDLLVKVFKEAPEKLYLEKDFSKDRVDSLYRVFKEQEKQMEPELRQSYLKAILELTQSPIIGAEPLK